MHLLLGFAALAGCGADSDETSGGTVSGGPVDADAAFNPARGQRLLAQYQCSSCHAIPQVSGTRRLEGPSLQAFGQRSYIAGHLPNRADTLAQWIMAPQSLVPGTTMPNMGVSLEEARHMAAFLGSLR